MVSEIPQSGDTLRLRTIGYLRVDHREIEEDSEYTTIVLESSDFSEKAILDLKKDRKWVVIDT